MAWKKYAKKQVKRVGTFARKRYTTKRGGVRVAQVARDLAMVKRQLNVEHKHIDYKFGSGQTVSGQNPTKSVPIILPIPTPVKGTGYNNRIGNQIRIVHMTMKLEIKFSNNNDLIQRTGMKAQILFAKSADDIPDITKLYEPDMNGHYTPASFANTQEWKKYTWIKGLDISKAYTQPTNRYPVSRGDGTTVSPVDGTTQINVTTLASVSLNIGTFHINKSCKVSVRTMFENSSENVKQMKPYLLLRSDVIDATIDYDPINITGQIRMTYVDN